jgi:hypothetical protein
MVGLIVLTIIVGLGIYYVTTLDFEVGTGISEEKKKAKEVKYMVSEPETPKEIAEKNI